jgi:hypothetical protein
LTSIENKTRISRENESVLGANEKLVRVYSKRLLLTLKMAFDFAGGIPAIAASTDTIAISVTSHDTPFSCPAVN